MTWTMRKKFILQTFHLASMLYFTLWVREMGKKGHFQSEGERKGVRKAARPHAECVVCFVISPESSLQGPRSEGPLSACSPRSSSFSVRLPPSLLAFNPQVALRMVPRVAARPCQPGHPYHSPPACEALATRAFFLSLRHQPRPPQGVRNTFLPLVRRVPPHLSALGFCASPSLKEALAVLSGAHSQCGSQGERVRAPSCPRGRGPGGARLLPLRTQTPG